jgi:hypothetical protein
MRVDTVCTGKNTPTRALSRDAAGDAIPAPRRPHTADHSRGRFVTFSLPGCGSGLSRSHRSALT